MTITTEELARIRAIAEADKEGADGKAWDEAITPDTVIALCRELELARLNLNVWIGLTWTGAPPKEPGWYWNRSKNYPNEACIIRVSKYRIEQLGRMGCSQNEQWAGPILEPREPK